MPPSNSENAPAASANTRWLAGFAPIKVAARTLVHCILGVSFGVAVLWLPFWLLFSAAAAMTLVFAILDVVRLRVPALNARFRSVLALFLRPDEENHVTGATYFLLGAGATVLIFPRDVAALAVLFLALGDPVAGIVGRWRGRLKLWGRTLEGDLACAAVCVLTALVFNAVVGGPGWLAGMLGALAATFFQMLPRVNDNLTIPAGSAATMLLARLLLG
jgi:dolichol kinase